MYKPSFLNHLDWKCQRQCHCDRLYKTIHNNDYDVANLPISPHLARVCTYQSIAALSRDWPQMYKESINEAAWESDIEQLCPFVSHYPPPVFREKCKMQTTKNVSVHSAAPCQFQRIKTNLSELIHQPVFCLDHVRSNNKIKSFYP